ncbi:zeta toxin-domain-containing protein [Xylariomycetidae sp. FL2044]|nr:zeta toxin-domain-containing protein [Xylariomycetidae sp. FL2044]
MDERSSQGRPLAQSYVLSDEESRRIFERDIVAAELSHLPKSLITLTNTGVTRGDDNDDDDDGDRDDRNNTKATTPAPAPALAPSKPLAVFILGQTGAGKTLIAPALQRAITRVRPAPPTHLIADAYKAYHPAYLSLLSSSARPGLASPATSTDARRWLAQAASYAGDRRADVLLESACRHRGDFAALARGFRRRGYRVEVIVLAVPAGLSRLGVLTRFYEGLPEAGVGRVPRRLTPVAVHDEAYAGVLDAAAFVDGDARGEGDDGEDEAVVDQVLVVRRDGLVAYANERVVDGTSWSQEAGGGGGAADALRLERMRPLVQGERESATRCLTRLRGLGIPELGAQLDEVEELLRPLLADDDDDGAKAEEEEEDEGRSRFPILRPLLLPGDGLNHGTGLRLGG